ncbi:MAG: hypothetical protein PWQ70_3189 [Clostridiales bacterium]|jgi:rubrerythrin|nr:hypothetical protein [Clostridiales bacterium]
MMTVQSDLQKAIASAQAALGTYATMAQSTQDQSAKNMFTTMQQDMQKHVDWLNGRLNYLNENNTLNNQQQQ